jgi:hypothetical protein
MNRNILTIIAACTLTMSVNLQAMRQASASPTDMSVGKIAELITGLLRAPAASMVTKNEFTNPELAKKYQALASSLRITNAILSGVNGYLRLDVIDATSTVTSTLGFGLGSIGFIISDWVELARSCGGKTPEALTGDALKQKQQYEVHALEGLLAGGCALTNGTTLTNKHSDIIKALIELKLAPGSDCTAAMLIPVLIKSLYPHGLLATLLTTVRLVEKIVKQHRDNEGYVLLGGLTALYVPLTCIPIKTMAQAVINAKRS